MTLPAAYARAIYEVRQQGAVTDEALVASVQEALKVRHHEKLLPSILAEYRKLEADEKRRGTSVRAASESEVAAGLAKLKDLGAEGTVRTVVDPTLVKGFVLSGKDFRYDASAKRSLIELYKQLISA